MLYTKSRFCIKAPKIPKNTNIRQGNGADFPLHFFIPTVALSTRLRRREHSRKLRSCCDRTWSIWSRLQGDVGCLTGESKWITCLSPCGAPLCKLCCSIDLWQAFFTPSFFDFQVPSAADPCRDQPHTRDCFGDVRRNWKCFVKLRPA